MARKRSPEHDYVCRRCGVACSPTQHYAGVRGQRYCSSPEPMLRRDYQAWMDQMAQEAVAAIRERRRPLL